MKLTQIRNATMKIEYAGKRFLIDPMLAEKGAYPGFAGTLNAHLSNPLVSLPLDMAQIVDVDAVIVTHTHLDHWDTAAARLLPKEKIVFTQNKQDAEIIRAEGFQHVHILSDKTEFAGIILSKTSGQHGSDEAYADDAIAQRLGEACGIVFTHPQEKTLYLAGDTVWNHHIDSALSTYRPDVVVLNAGYAQIDRFGAIIMGTEDVFQVHKKVPDAVLIATHMEAINHCALTRNALRQFSREHGFNSCLRVPEDGESCTL